MAVDLKKIGTEQRNPNTMNIDVLATEEIIKKINEEDKKVAFAVEKAIPEITPLVEKVVEAFYKDGRLIYLGAGTSGRIGVVDAVECRPTYGVSDEMVQCLMAGGTMAFVKAVEGAEDNKELCVSDLKGINLTANDVVVGIAASGRTPYVIGGLEYAKKIGAVTGCIVTSPNSVIAGMVDFPITAVTGEEAITGSTRMKSGTAQKMICNIISTTAMVKMGKVYENLMIDVMPTNEKLYSRAYNIISMATGVSVEEAKELMAKYKTVKKAIFSVMSGVKEEDKIDEYLQVSKGHIRNALKAVK